MMRWLEKNGYNVSYTAESEVDQSGVLLKNHKVFMSSGHDEYWSAGQRANVLAAREAGVNLAFFSGNEIFWKTRWAPSSEGSNTPYRTLITYKETHFNAPVDPQDPTVWTGAWRDPRFSPPADGGQPENALTGQQFEVNSGTSDIAVPSQYSKLRLWRNTAVAGLEPGQTLALAPGTGTLGYEWDEDVDNGFRPAGEFDLSSTTVSGVQAFMDYGTTLSNNSTATHNLTMYRAPSGALVFGAGTVQWSWGLENVNAWEAAFTDPSHNPPDLNIEQFTVNLLAEMGVQPGSLSSGLVAVSQSTDTTPPTSTIASPAAGANRRRRQPGDGLGDGDRFRWRRGGWRGSLDRQRDDVASGNPDHPSGTIRQMDLHMGGAREPLDDDQVPRGRRQREPGDPLSGRDRQRLLPLLDMGHEHNAASVRLGRSPVR